MGKNIVSLWISSVMMALLVWAIVSTAPMNPFGLMFIGVLLGTSILDVFQFLAAKMGLTPNELVINDAKT